MQFQFQKKYSSHISHALYFKSAAILTLFILSVLIVACGSNPTNDNLGQPAVTVTINLDQSNGSPTPPLPEYTCSAWVTNTTPSIYTTRVIGVYAKFVHNVHGNPEGVSPATATATVLWPDGSVSVSATTTPDGLAVFPVSVANRAADLNKIILVTVAFQGPPGVPPCTVSADRAAFFTLIIASPMSSAVPGSSPPVGATSTTAVTVSPTPFPTVDPIPDPRPCPPPHGHKPTPTPCA